MKGKHIFFTGLLFVLSPVLYFFIGMFTGSLAFVDDLIPILLISSPVLLIIGAIIWFIQSRKKNK